MVERQLRRYFVGTMSFAFVVTWFAVGALAAFLGLLGAVATSVVLPALVDTRRARRRATGRRVGNERRPRVTARPLADEVSEELPLVPDEPSLIIGLSS
jgi:hypothetical protein